MHSNPQTWDHVSIVLPLCCPIIQNFFHCFPPSVTAAGRFEPSNLGLCVYCSTTVLTNLSKLFSLLPNFSTSGICIRTFKLGIVCLLFYCCADQSLKKPFFHYYLTSVPAGSGFAPLSLRSCVYCSTTLLTNLTKLFSLLFNFSTCGIRI